MNYWNKNVTRLKKKNLERILRKEPNIEDIALVARGYTRNMILKLRKELGLVAMGAHPYPTRREMNAW